MYQCGASVLIGLFESISITNGFLNFRASNFLVFTSQNTPKTALPPRRAFQYCLMIQSSVAKAAEYFPLSFLGAIANAVALFCIKKGGNSAFPFPVGSEQKGVLILFRWEISGDSEPLIPRKPTLYFAWKEVTQMAVFRIEKARDYTVMSNHHLRDQSLSLKAKGLLSMMLSLPEEWNYTTCGLASICKEGTDSIGSALKELERTGYIVRNRLRDSKGKILDVEYVIYETPHPAAEPDTAAPDTAFPYPENPDMDIPCLEKPSQLNIDRESNYANSEDFQVLAITTMVSSFVAEWYGRSAERHHE